MHAFIFADSIEQVERVTSRAIITLEGWGYPKFAAFTLRALLHDGFDFEPDDEGLIHFTPDDVSLAKVRDHLAALLNADRDAVADRMDPERWGDYYTALLDLGSEFWNRGSEDDPKASTPTG